MHILKHACAAWFVYEAIVIHEHEFVDLSLLPTGREAKSIERAALRKICAISLGVQVKRSHHITLSRIL